uniref:Uncharacterized protein n=1 Tax=Rhizophora mucronata TaxID=61149 RepID=A0A2P2NY02_RHIMU
MVPFEEATPKQTETRKQLITVRLKYYSS